VISSAIRQRIGAMLRDPVLDPAVRRPRPEPRVVPTSIEDILPGGVMIGREGAVFVHERLYTDLNERPTPLLKKYEQIARPPESGADGARRVPRTLP